jgi:sucrose phosphorylase
MVQSERITAHSYLIALYGQPAGDQAFERLSALMEYYRDRPAFQEGRDRYTLSERDSVLITYADQLSERDIRPLKTLNNFCGQYLAGLLNSIHLLPFFPYSSDDGFSVSNYEAVNSLVGRWDDVARLGRHFRLMFDAVINHVSVQHAWFQAFLKDDPHYRDYFIVVDGAPDLSQVVRPRALPLLTTFKTPSGPKQVWTTFSADQVDLNYKNPAVLLEIINLLLFYVEHGAQLIRLDAIAYLWKEIGTSCIHLPQTHLIIRLFRAVLDSLAPHVLLITETNVPHEDNLSYFGDGQNEAQLVYNFALPPLVLHTFAAEDSLALSKWVAGLRLPSDRTTFFNFLASHDGIGLNPARGILSQAEIDALVERTLQHGGLVSYKDVPGGEPIPYELNINYFDALSNPNAEEDSSLPVECFMTAQAIMLALVGVPGIYFHSLFGSRGWPAGFKLTRRKRTINRQKFDLSTFENELTDGQSLRYQVFRRYAQLLVARSATSAFHPHGEQKVLERAEALFALLRISPDGSQRVLCLHNISSQIQTTTINWMEVLGPSSGQGTDLITLNDHPLNGTLALQPYQTLWLRIKK